MSKRDAGAAEESQSGDAGVIPLAKRIKFDEEGLSTDGAGADANDQKPEFESSTTKSDTQQEDDEKKCAKRKMVLIFGYCGDGYQGLQRNANAWTIEDELEKALFAAGAISPQNMGSLTKIAWIRACRTDKGVHAVGNAVSAKLLMAGTGAELVERVNSHLPAGIRVFVCQRVMNNFNAKNFTDHRVYEYLLPTRACMPILRNADFKFDAAAHGRLSHLFSLFHGTRNYHNFTQGMTYRDPAVKRFIKSIVVSQPFEVNDEPGNPPLEVVRIVLTGQSFILNQIRKMIAMVLIVNRHSAPDNVLLNCFGERNLNTPMVPGEFLTLDQTVYEAYNRRLTTMDSDCPPLDLLEPTVLAAREKFKMEVIYPMMVRKERSENLTGRLLGLIDKFKPLVDGKPVDIYAWLKLYSETAKSVPASGAKTPKETRREAYEQRLAAEQQQKQQPPQAELAAPADVAGPVPALSAESLLAPSLPATSESATLSESSAPAISSADGGAPSLASATHDLSDAASSRLSASIGADDLDVDLDGDHRSLSSRSPSVAAARGAPPSYLSAEMSSNLPSRSDSLSSLSTSTASMPLDGPGSLGDDSTGDITAAAKAFSAAPTQSEDVTNVTFSGEHRSALMDALNKGPLAVRPIPGAPPDSETS